MLASSRKPCGGGGIHGRMLWAAGMAAANRMTVGRGALTPPGPAAAQTFAGGYGIRPYKMRRMFRLTGKTRRRQNPRPTSPFPLPPPRPFPFFKFFLTKTGAGDML